MEGGCQMDKVKSFEKNTIIVNSLIHFLLLTFSFSLLLSALHRHHVMPRIHGMTQMHF